MECMLGCDACLSRAQILTMNADDVILPSAEGPGFMYVRESTATQYVPGRPCSCCW